MDLHLRLGRLRIDRLIHTPSVARHTLRAKTVQPMKKIRIIIADVPAMLRDIVAEIIAAEPDLAIVDAIPNNADVKAAVRRSGADVVITQQADSEASFDNTALLYARHPLKVIAITGNACEGLLYDLRPHCESLGELSAAALVAAIRGAAQSAG